MDISLFKSYRDRIVGNCGKIILGKDDAIEKLLICFLCGGHILIEDVPGTGKTMLLRAFAKSIGGEFKRVQFTPDLLPSDLTGINFYNNKTGEFEFRKGPLFAQVILADEINRATPRTQSSLLEAMEERQITVDGTTYRMADPFIVMATQNPLESYGTFPLPDAQIDRFFMRLSLGYMERRDEMVVIARKPAAVLVDELTAVITGEETNTLKELRDKITVSQDVAEYIMDIIWATRSGRTARGASARGGIALWQASQVKAAFSGRDYVIPEDVRDMAPAVLAHRIGGGTTSRADEEKLINDLVSEIKAPLEEV